MSAKRRSKEISDREEQSADLLRRHCPEGRVLDLPCGRGDLSRRLHELGYEVVSADIVQGIFEPKDLPWRRMDLDEPFGFDDASFDAVCCVAGIEHAANPYQTLREFGRILKPGGFLVLQFPNFSALLRRIRFMLSGRLTRRRLPLPREGEKNMGSGHISCLTLEQSRHLLATTLFEVVERRLFRVHRRTAFWGFPLWGPLSLVGLLQAVIRGGQGRSEALTPQVLLHAQVVLIARKAGEPPPTAQPG